MIERLDCLILPTLGQLLDDLGRHRAPALARALGVHRRTLERWSAHGDAPRAALLALYWVSRWGQSELDCELHNRATLYTAHIAAAQRENAALRRELARVLSAGDFGAANRPSWAESAADLLALPVRAATGHRTR